ncbi:MAG: ABC transporter substrate-binding protein [Anaerovorax sp.]|nr:ABC transporter substrate-binding protein [Anaerovorax sp.]
MTQKRKRRLALLCSVVVLLMSLLGGCATFENFQQGFFTKKTEEVVRFGVYQPLSGADKEEAELEIKGIELAHKLFPQALGKQVELIYADNKSDVFAAEAAAKELVEKRVALVLGSYGNALSLVGSDIFKKEKIPAIAATCTNPLVTSSSDFYFRACFVDSFQGNAAAKFVNESLGVSQAIVLKQTDNDYASAMSQMFSDKMIALTGDPNAIVNTLEFKKGDKDYSEQLDAISASGVPIVYLPCTEEEGITILKQAKEKGITATFVGTDKWDTENFLKKGGQAVEGAAFTTLFDAESSLTEMSQLFLEAYQKEYGVEEKPESAVALGFDAYLLAVNALNNAGTALNGETIRDQLFKTKEFQGATGSISLNLTGDPVKSVVIEAVENGAFVHKYTAEPTWGQ